ncbi:MAG: dihydrolipoyl dehydrogenase, partial [Dokdonella sp.]
MDIHNVEVVIIGSGTAGMAAYREVRKRCERIALIEGGPFGTTCARVGCMPSKLLIAPAEARHRLQALPEFGIHSDAGRVDGHAVMRRVREERDRFIGFVVEAVDTFDPAHIVRGYAAFDDPHTLRLSSAFDGSAPRFDRIRADRIVIATGSRPNIPDAFKPAGDRLITSNDVFDWQDLPASVAVFGAGVVGLELGQALHRLGVRVRLFGQGGRIGGISDPVIREYAAKTIGGELPTSLDAKNVRIDRDGDQVIVHFVDANGSISERFDYLLAATGRTANLDRLTLENSGLSLDARGKPAYDAQTTRAGDSHIFIAGDANNDRPILHEANDEGHLAGQSAAVYPDVFRKARRESIGIV